MKSSGLVTQGLSGQEEVRVLPDMYWDSPEGSDDGVTQPDLHFERALGYCTGCREGRVDRSIGGACRGFWNLWPQFLCVTGTLTAQLWGCVCKEPAPCLVPRDNIAKLCPRDPLLL